MSTKAKKATVTKEQAATVLPHVRAAVAALHEVWAECRAVERLLDADLDGLEGVVQDMAAGLDHATSVDAKYIREALEPLLAELVDAASACPRCGERRQDNLVWQKDGKVKCSNCGMRYEPAAGD
ncbi:MAG: hypothetical protein ISS74_08560 [Planctomycetes bacterium]|nr:hypothetical protein [Planctomycetota bacterium]